LGSLRMEAAGSPVLQVAVGLATNIQDPHQEDLDTRLDTGLELVQEDKVAVADRDKEHLGVRHTAVAGIHHIVLGLVPNGNFLVSGWRLDILLRSRDGHSLHFHDEEQ